MTTLIQLPARSSSAIPRSGTWLNLVAHLDPKYGGISAVLPPLCEAVTAAGGDASLIPFCGPDERYNVAPSIPLDVFPLGMKRWLLEGELRRRLADHVVESAGIHIHGIWQEHCLFGAQAARDANKPYVLSAHGMLDPWALRNKGWKKRIYSALIERRNVSGAACLHALTSVEAQEYREFGARNPNKICQPMRGERRKHPVLLPRNVFHELKNSNARDLKIFLLEHTTSLSGFESNDAGLDLDMDTPEDYERVKSFAGL